MTTLKLSTNSKDVKIFIQNSCLNKANNFLELEKYPQIIILTDENVADFWLDNLLDNLKHKNIHSYVIPSGETEKNIERVQDIWEFLAENKVTRHDLLINLGGGVITDLGGFVASTYFRGISFVNIPTTLLSQTDASIGGKTGINFAENKNSIGTFCQPEAIIIDPLILKTLPEREFSAGFGEVIKYALIEDKKFFKFLKELEISDLKKDENLLKIIENSAKLKIKIVEKDELESGLRKILNFGHTIGHALESLSLKTESPLLHGEAVGLGMLIEAEISREIGLLSAENFLEIRKLLKKFNFLDKIPATFTVKKIMGKIEHDKKNFAEKTRWVLLSDTGKAEIDQIVDDKITEKVLNEFY